ncbi:class I SAM-dependent methyltransferase [Amycolatopsis benzoatilytica]|uniref:class I SAM-dependent methyltransferase n=1 Tax=Amycolatopsis benzoatilytica TaxID=346045 RepID=UPI00036F680E|nr:class I SAM-dependent methyltransferase [Amycolatopsis benzoatilytica]
MEFSEDDAAAVYDVTNPWRAEPGTSDAFYTGHAMAAGSVLDVGCGTGQMLHLLRRQGHHGRLAGIDPDRAALRRARRRTDVEWVEGPAADIPWRGEFELATMANNAFQCLVTDGDIAASLTAVRAALAAGGRFVFETRNPQARAWEAWAAAEPVPFEYDGRSLATWWEVESAEDGVVTFTETVGELDRTTPLRADRATLRFLDVDPLNAALRRAGFAVEHQYGDFSGGPLTETSQSIVTVARAG